MIAPTEPGRVALIGYGHIGRALHAALSASPYRLAVVGIAARRRPEQVASPDVPWSRDPASLLELRPDLVVEAAHPDVTRLAGERILAAADYLPLSLTALADPGRLEQLEAAAAASGHRLLIAHGAVVGGDSLVEGRGTWSDVEIEFRKPPASLRPADGQPSDVSQETVLFEGSVREIAPRFPLNVNAMVACALMTVGLDRCRARLVADPEAQHAHLRIVARGRDGSLLDVRRVQPLAGVSGTEMARSALQSVLRAAGRTATVDYV